MRVFFILGPLCRQSISVLKSFFWMLIEKEWSQGHWIQKLFISLNLSAQDHSNDIKIIKIEQVKPIKNSFESV